MRKRVEWLRERLGPLGWGTAVVFVIWRIGDVAALATKVLLGRWLPPLDFGALEPIFSLLSVFCLPVAVLYQVAMKSISRLHAQGELDGCRALIRDLAKISLVGSAASAVAALALHSYILTRLHLDKPLYILCLALLLAAAWWTPLVSAVVQGMRKYRYMPYTVLLGPVTGFALTLVFVVGARMGLAGALVARALSMPLMVLAFVFAARSTFVGPRRSYRAEARGLAGMLLPMAAFVSANTLLLHFDRLFVRNFLLAESPGYGAVITLGQIPIWIIAPITFVVFPLASATHATGGNVRRNFTQALLMGAGAGVLCVVLLAWLSAPLLGLWNRSFAPYAGYVWPYAGVMTLHCLSEIVASVEMARHRYAFLWWMVFPAIGLCAWLYAQRVGMTLDGVIAALACAHAFMLVGVGATSLFGFRSDPVRFSGAGAMGGCENERDGG